jgi:hypothetical protein
MLDTQSYRKLVPKLVKKNLKFRAKLLLLATGDAEFRFGLRKLCEQDPLFYLNAFCWLFEPREGRKLPFITYDFQDDAMAEIDSAVAHHDLVTDKSRDMGATWMHLAIMDWRCRSPDAMHTFLVLSRKEELVDKRGDPKCLFWKLDFLRRTLPIWLQYPVERRAMHIQYLHNEATVDGESTNEFAGVADRRTGIFLDELSLMPNQANILRGTRDVTKCRMFTFTPRGAGNTAYKIAHSTKFRKQTLHWNMHPGKREGLYISQNGKLVILDVDYWKRRGKSDYAIQMNNPVPVMVNGDFSFQGVGYQASANAFDYEFTLDGKLRSAWYDNECERTVNPWEIPQELDISYLGSDYQYFSKADVLDRLTEKAEHPITQGELLYDRDSCMPTGFEANAEGRLSLWIAPMDGMILGSDAYVLGADIAAGTGGTESSNSAVVVYNRDTCEKVAEYVNPHIEPPDLAKFAVSLARWFNDAFMIWEANGGHGGTFSKRVYEIGYRKYYHRKSVDNPNAKSQDQLGWWTTRDNKLVLLDAYRDGLYTEQIANKSYWAIDECRYYVYRPNGSVAHSKSAETEDGSGAGANHGDRVIADAVAYWVMRKTKATKPGVQEVRVAPVGCAQWRKEKRLRADKKSVSRGRWSERRVVDAA